jgi:hypothetical protein
MITIWKFTQFNYCEISGNFDAEQTSGDCQVMPAGQNRRFARSLDPTNQLSLG